MCVGELDALELCEQLGACKLVAPAFVPSGIVASCQFVGTYDLSEVLEPGCGPVRSRRRVP